MMPKFSYILPISGLLRSMHCTLEANRVVNTSLPMHGLNHALCLHPIIGLARWMTL